MAAALELKRERKKERSCRRACERESADADGRDSGADDDDDDDDGDDVVADDEVDLLSPLALEFLSQFFGITGKLQSNRSASVKFQIR